MCWMFPTWSHVCYDSVSELVISLQTCSGTDCGGLLRWNKEPEGGRLRCWTNLRVPLVKLQSFESCFTAVPLTRYSCVKEGATLMDDYKILSLSRSLNLATHLRLFLLGMSSPGGGLSEEQFSCSICLEVFVEPVSTPCGHSFCKACLQGYWNHSKKFICPMCKKSYSRKPEMSVNRVLAEISTQFQGLMSAGEAGGPAGPGPSSRGSTLSLNSGSGHGGSPGKTGEFAQAGEVPCDSCIGRKLKALKSCVNCPGSFCESHLRHHKKVSCVPFLFWYLINCLNPANASSVFLPVCDRPGEVPDLSPSDRTYFPPRREDLQETRTSAGGLLSHRPHLHLHGLRRERAQVPRHRLRRPRMEEEDGLSLMTPPRVTVVIISDHVCGYIQWQLHNLRQSCMWAGLDSTQNLNNTSNLLVLFITVTILSRVFPPCRVIWGRRGPSWSTWSRREPRNWMKSNNPSGSSRWVRQAHKTRAH